MRSKTFQVLRPSGFPTGQPRSQRPKPPSSTTTLSSSPRPIKKPSMSSPWPFGASADKKNPFCPKTKRTSTAAFLPKLRCFTNMAFWKNRCLISLFCIISNNWELNLKFLYTLNPALMWTLHSPSKAEAFYEPAEPLLNPPCAIHFKYRITFLFSFGENKTPMTPTLTFQKT